MQTVVHPYTHSHSYRIFGMKAVICRIPMILKYGFIEMQTIWRIHINIVEIGAMKAFRPINISFLLILNYIKRFLSAALFWRIKIGAHNFRLQTKLLEAKIVLWYVFISFEDGH